MVIKSCAFKFLLWRSFPLYIKVSTSQSGTIEIFLRNHQFFVTKNIPKYLHFANQKDWFSSDQFVCQPLELLVILKDFQICEHKRNVSAAALISSHFSRKKCDRLFRKTCCIKYAFKNEHNQSSHTLFSAVCIPSALCI